MSKLAVSPPPASNTHMVVLCLCLILVSLAISLPLTRWMIAVGLRWGQLDKPGAAGHKQHERAVPATGGIAIVAGVVLPMLAILAAARWLSADHLPDALRAVGPHLAGLRAQSLMGLGIIVAALALHIVGLVDDRRGLGPLPKFVAQGAVAVALVVTCDMRVLTLLDQYGSVGVIASGVISALWLVTVINAMNFLDNMDGLAAGVGAIIAAEYLAATLIGGQWFVAGLAALLLGALAGFLVFNRHPARIFMGDAGSLVLGLLLGVISIRTTYFIADVAPAADAAHAAPRGAWYGILMPLVVLAVPLYDLISVTFIRLRAGRSPFVGDRNHFSHRLVRRGLRPPTAVAIIWLCTLATGLGGVMLGSLAGWQAALVAGQVVAVLALLAALESGTNARE